MFKRTRFSIVAALTLLTVLAFSVRNPAVGRAGPDNTGWRVAFSQLAASAVRQSQVMTSAIDVLIRSDQPISNFGEDPTLQIGVEAGNQSHVLLYFQVDGNPLIPYQSIIHSATLQLARLSGGTPTTATISAHSVITDWHGITDKLQWEKDVTWDVQPAITAPAASTVSAPITTGTLDIDITDLFAGWLNDPGNFLNYGLMLKGDPAESAYNLLFASKEAGQAPSILVDFTPQPSVIAITRTVGTVVIDNNCSSTEYPDQGYRFVDADQRYNPVYIAHDGNNLYICSENVASDFPKRFFAAYFDTDNAKEEKAEKDDLVFYLNPVTGVADNEQGSGNSYDPIPNLENRKLSGWEGKAGLKPGDSSVEVAEYMIPFGLINLTCKSRAIGISLYHHWVRYGDENPVGADDYGWPSDRQFNVPKTWIEATLADVDHLPTDCPVPTVPTALPTPTRPTVYLPLVNR